MAIHINWDDPEARAGLLQRIGPKAFNEAHEANRKASVIEVCAGHDLRPVSTSFGRLIAVGSTLMAFATLEQARAYATENPAKPQT